ncbi:MAG TPA: Uma2 family endonuclease [Planctomycetota bacterium]|nr:Uma2 family endonuclease [Planctomycetota bacterium]
MLQVETELQTLEDLYREDGKAELIGGRIVRMMATGFLPGRIACRILYSLEAFSRQSKTGYALCDNVGYAVKQLASGRQSFSPDVSFYSGKLQQNLIRFIEGPPTFAVEIRSENDYTQSGDFERAAKRADYFEAGTLVVWDVDTLAKSIHSYKITAPYSPVTFHISDTADAEPAVPGWSMALDQIFSI